MQIVFTPLFPGISVHSNDRIYSLPVHRRRIYPYLVQAEHYVIYIVFAHFPFSGKVICEYFRQRLSKPKYYPNLTFYYIEYQ